MNDEQAPKDSGTAATAQKQAAPKTESAGETEEKSGLFNRLKRLIRLGRNGSLRENLENELSREEGDTNADFSPEERLLLGNILNFRKVRVEDVMVPRADIDAVEQDESLVQLINRFRESGHSRMPVFKNNLDDPKGMVHIKDVMEYVFEHSQMNNGDGQSEDSKLIYEFGRLDLSKSILTERLIRPVLFAPPSMLVTDLLVRMQASRTQIALVIDEYGGTDGLVSLEDIVEVVFGDIEDEHDDEEEPVIKMTRENIWIADARVDIEDARKVLGENFCTDEQWEEIDTLGGLLFTLAGRVPVRGEMISSAALAEFEFEVIDADQRKIKRMKIHKRRADLRAGEPRKSRRKASEMQKSA